MARLLFPPTSALSTSTRSAPSHPCSAEKSSRSGQSPQKKIADVSLTGATWQLRQPSEYNDSLNKMLVERNWVRHLPAPLKHVG